MTNAPHILLLAGSFEARRAAQALQARGLRYAAWLSEAPRGPDPMPQAPVVQSFETVQEMREALVQGGFTAVLDASHTFDRRMTLQGVAAARALALPYLRVERPAWEAERPNWTRVPDVAAANAMIGPQARVFAATGWDSLDDFADFAGAQLMLRQTRRHARPAPYRFVRLVFGDPPFRVAGETALFSMLRIDTLVCRNLGGPASRPKLDAAVALGMEVILIERPALPDGIKTVADIDAARPWIAAL